MSHSVTIQTRTVTSGSPSSINTGFCRTWPGLLKLTQVILGIVSLIFLWMHVKDYNSYNDHRLVFLITMVTAFFITTLLLVLSYTCSFTTETIISKTTFEVLYHGVGFALLLVSAVLVLTRGQRYHESNEKTASVVGLIIFILEWSVINHHQMWADDMFLMSMATAFMMGTFIFIVSYIFSPVSEAIISKTNYEIFYNAFALFFLFVSSLLVVVSYGKHSAQTIAGVLGIINAILYAGSLAFAVKRKI